MPMNKFSIIKNILLKIYNFIIIKNTYINI
jgi:hypothetical protein